MLCCARLVRDTEELESAGSTRPLRLKPQYSSSPCASESVSDTHCSSSESPWVGSPAVIPDPVASRLLSPPV